MKQKEKEKIDIINRIPPHSLEAEKAILSTMIIDNNTISDILEKITEEMFYSTPHQAIFSSVSKLKENNIAVDLTTLSNYILSNELLSKIGSLSYLSEITRSIASTTNLEYYINILKEKSTLRQLLQKSIEIQESVYSNKNIDEIVDEAQQSIFELQLKDEKKDLILLKDKIDDVTQDIQNYAKKHIIKTDFENIDNIIRSLEISELIFICARPSVGKTSFGLNIALNMANQISTDDLKKRKIAFYSLETSTEKIIKRILSIESGINCQKGLQGDEFSRMIDSIGNLYDKYIYINDTSTIKTLDIKNQIRKMKQKNNEIDVVIIDYVQLMKPVHTKKSDNRNIELCEISRELKILAKELGIIIICLAQLNRKSDNSDDSPSFADIRDSGAFEQDADKIIFLWKTKNNKYSLENTIDVNFSIAKNKDGATGQGVLKFRKDISSFVNSCMLEAPF